MTRDSAAVHASRVRVGHALKPGARNQELASSLTTSDQNVKTLDLSNLILSLNLISHPHSSNLLIRRAFRVSFASHRFIIHLLIHITYNSNVSGPKTLIVWGIKSIKCRKLPSKWSVRRFDEEQFPVNNYFGNLFSFASLNLCHRRSI